MLKINLQFFAEEEPAAEEVAKTFSADYVKALRDESKDHRLARKAAEEKAAATELKFKKFLELKDTDELDDSKITAYQTKHQQEVTAAMQKANDRLLQAEVKSLEGYDSKLILRLLDKSKVKIDEDGNITGLKETVEELAKEFPAILKTAPSTSPANPPNAGGVTLQDEYNQALKDAQANPRNSELTKKVFLLKERLRT